MKSNICEDDYMVEKAASQITDNSDAKSVALGSGAFQVSDEGRAALVHVQTKHVEDLKEGRVRSFVAEELGTLVLVNNEKPVGSGPEGGRGCFGAVEMPKIGGTDNSVRMPTDDEESFQNLDLDFFKVTAAEALGASPVVRIDQASEAANVYGTVELKSADKAHVVVSKGLKESNAPHEANKGIVSTHRDKDGSRTYTYKDKTTETVSRDGKERDVKFPDGSGYHLYPEGRKLIRHADDTRDAYDPQGDIEWRRRKRTNGDYAYTNARGQLSDYACASGEHSAGFTYDSQGKLERITGLPPVGNWTLEKRQDGTTYWQNTDNPKQQFDGEMTVDGDGNIYQIPHDP